LSQQRNRERARRGKDHAQGEILLQAIAAHMPHYRLDNVHTRKLPEPLRKYAP
jgi:hypothetical protein